MGLEDNNKMLDPGSHSGDCVLWDVMPGKLEVHRRFRRTCCPHLVIRKVSQPRNSNSLSDSHLTQGTLWPFHFQGDLELPKSTYWEENRACFLFLILCLGYSSTLKMEAVCPSERSVKFYQTTRHHILDESKGKIVPVLRRVGVYLYHSWPRHWMEVSGQPCYKNVLWVRGPKVAKWRYPVADIGFRGDTSSSVTTDYDELVLWCRVVWNVWEEEEI
jgi:hypothetical protein